MIRQKLVCPMDLSTSCLIDLEFVVGLKKLFGGRPKVLSENIFLLIEDKIIVIIMVHRYFVFVLRSCVHYDIIWKQNLPRNTPWRILSVTKNVSSVSEANWLWALKNEIKQKVLFFSHSLRYSLDIRLSEK